MDNYGLAKYLGSLNLDQRPVVHNKDGSISTERSFGFSPDGKTEILIPTVVNGKILSNDEAVKHFYKTGEHLGTWDKQAQMKEQGLGEKAFYEGLNDYANKLHLRQAEFYKGK